MHLTWKIKALMEREGIQIYVRGKGVSLLLVLTEERMRTIEGHRLQLNIVRIRKNFVNWTGLLQVVVGSLSLKVF